jgi:hypothetical protein
MPAGIWQTGPQSPFYGIDLDNVTDRLTRLNWATKALVRRSAGGPLYVWIERDDGRGVRRRYRVGVAGLRKRRWDLECGFRCLSDALAYANGRDGRELARKTRPGRREDWPAHVTKELPWTIVLRP